MSILVITKQPVSLIRIAGSNALFTVHVKSDEPYDWHWEAKASAQSSWETSDEELNLPTGSFFHSNNSQAYGGDLDPLSNIDPDAINLSLPAIPARSGHIYRCVLVGSTTVISNEVTLTIVEGDTIMSNPGRITWDETSKRFYQTGCDRGVLYKQVNGAYPEAVPWNGLTAVSEQPEGADPTDIYADNIKYLSIRSAENYKATIEALYSPKEFDECDGTASPIAGVRISQQPRKPFGFSWRTIKGNAEQFNDYGYVIHVIYGATVDPTEKSYQTVNDSPDAMNLSWGIDTIPVNVNGYKPTAHMEFDCSEMTPAQVKVLEDTLYGTNATTGHGNVGDDDYVAPAEATVGRLPLPDELIQLIQSAA